MIYTLLSENTQPVWGHSAGFSKNQTFMEDLRCIRYYAKHQGNAKGKGGRITFIIYLLCPGNVLHHITFNLLIKPMRYLACLTWKNKGSDRASNGLRLHRYQVAELRFELRVCILSTTPWRPLKDDEFERMIETKGTQLGKSGDFATAFHAMMLAHLRVSIPTRRT